MSPTAPPSGHQSPGRWPEHRALRPTGRSPRGTQAETGPLPARLWEDTHTRALFLTLQTNNKWLRWRPSRATGLGPVDDGHLDGAGYQEVVRFYFLTWNENKSAKDIRASWVNPAWGSEVGHRRGQWQQSDLPAGKIIICTTLLYSPTLYTPNLIIFPLVVLLILSCVF